ncbi:MAG: glycosyltransferase [Alteromonadaceae bacterium]|nr:glycosyltransferase [Alteromonadaceae bacterium]
MTETICQGFAEALEFRLWPVRNPAGSSGLGWYLRKHGRLTLSLLRAGLSARGSCYFVPDSNGGLWANILEACVMRLLFRQVWLHHHVFSYVRRRDRRMAAILKILGPKARHIALGEAMAEGLRTGYDARSIHVLGNADFVREAPAARPRRRLDTVGFISNITREKGIGLFMEAMRLAQAAPAGPGPTGPDCVIAGPIRDESLKAEIEAFCAESPARRKWVGSVSGASKDAFFDDIDLLLFPSLYPNEALPVTIYEALAAGVPVLATRRGCIPGQLEGLDGCLDDADFAAGAAGRIAAWVADPESFAAASRAATESFNRQRDEDRCSLQDLIAKI